MSMVLSHGQATVERGFSVKGKLLVENLHMESLIAQRHIRNHMWSYDLQARDLDITRELLDCQFCKKMIFSEPEREISCKGKVF